MSAPVKATKVVLTHFGKLSRFARNDAHIAKIPARRMAMNVGGWLKGVRGGSSKEVDQQPQFIPTELADSEELQEDVIHRQFRKRQCIEEVRSYSPPEDASLRVQAIAEEIYGAQTNWSDVQLTDRRKKFNLLTKLIEELDHEIPNFSLHDMKTVEDVLTYFNTEVKDTSKFDDLTKLDLPKNLHMNLEFIRFDRETDKAHGGVTAFPGRDTIVSSMKYHRKYQGQSGGDVVNYPEEIIRPNS